MRKLRNLFIIIILASLVRFFALNANLSNHIFVMVFNIGSIVALWYLVEQLFPVKGYKYLKEVSAIFLAISPWHIMLIDYSWQINFSIFITIIGSLILLKTIADKLLLFLAIYILIIFANQFSTPFILGFSNTKVPIWLTDEQRREHGRDYNNFLIKLFHNKIVNYSFSFLDHYSEHFSGDFLFIAGDISIERKISDFGQMYLFDIAFLLIGFYAVIKKFNWRWGVILLWLALAPINSSLNFVPPDSLRSALMIVPLIIISSFGAIFLFELIHKYAKGSMQYFLILIVLLLIAWDLNRFLHQCLFRVC